ncbi:Rossmann-like and DUF2520 domain-containing protein [Dehalobacterium formicoaceticum]
MKRIFFFKNCTFDQRVMLLKIGFIGAGKAGKTLGLYFKNHGLHISGYYSKTIESARTGADLTGSRAYLNMDDLAAVSEILFITVPDQVLAEIDAHAALLIEQKSIDRGKIWFHVSGAHPANILAGIKRAGGSVGSMHPLQSLGDPVSGAQGLEEAWFSLEGTAEALEAGKTILEVTGGHYSLIDGERKPLYHAGASVISNFFVTLLASGMRYFAAVGMKEEDILQAIKPLVEGTWSNIQRQGTVSALTGPIVRGDLNTVHLHMERIQKELPTELDLYKALGLKTVEMIEGKRLTPEQSEKIKMILEDQDHE